MAEPSAGQVLEALVTFGRALILASNVAPDSCILSTKVAIEVLAAFGYKAKPVPVVCVVQNRVFVEAEAQGFDLAATPHSGWPEGAYSVGLGFWEDEGKAGHLIATVEDEILLDMSLDQASRPHMNIRLHASAFAMPSDFLEPGGGNPVYEAHGAHVMYRVDWSHGQWWTRSPNWGKRDEGHRRFLAGSIIRTITAAYA